MAEDSQTEDIKGRGVGWAVLLQRILIGNSSPPRKSPTEPQMPTANLSEVNTEEVPLRCPDVDVAQRCSSSAECPLLTPRRDGISDEQPGTTSASEFVGRRVSQLAPDRG
ncbi:unnamed protein product [Pleuronectes platessa]|uniref:Uncharacterized protein n=1 Tax=Pleuronectes platessa TaxID=8262 RepID=A0A9N7TH08_PLEPL|nr:unnamed protein product [Pleuronectes platessa]